MIIGAAVLALGLYLLLGDNQHQIHPYAIYTIIVIGAAMTFTCLLGSIAICCESASLLIVFSVFMVAIIVIGNIGTVQALLAYLTGKDVNDILEASLDDSVANYGKFQISDAAMDTIQREFMCCGADGPLDYAKSYMNHQGSMLNVILNSFTVPKSCCKDPDGSLCDTARKLSIGGVVVGTIYSEGCAGKITTTLQQHKDIVIGVALGLVGLELVLLIIAITLIVSICRSTRRHYAADEASAPMMGHSKM